MLVLSRKQNERIRVGDSVVVTIVRVSGDKVRIGIEAPPHVRVLRDELNPDDEFRAAAGTGNSFAGTIAAGGELRLAPTAEQLLNAAG
jgi:carbon storage regulator